MRHVCVSVYHLQSGAADERLLKARETAYPVYRPRPGFVASEPFLTGDDSRIGVTTRDAVGQARAGTAVDEQWVAERGFTTTKLAGCRGTWAASTSPPPVVSAR